MEQSFYKGYWMVTNRCNLNCSYCVLEDSPSQKALELDLENKKKLVTHLYEKLNFRKLTLSGGEITIIGKRPPLHFLELVEHIRLFRSPERLSSLGIEMYTNGAYLTEDVVQAMQGVIDVVAVTIDSTNPIVLRDIGRNNNAINNYYEMIIEKCRLLSRAGIKIKLHSVVSTKNYENLSTEVCSIAESLLSREVDIDSWKFYQYMSYDVPNIDKAHAISNPQYKEFKYRVSEFMEPYHIKLHFKDNVEMNDSLFNILSYGNAQYMRSDDTWSTSQRTRDLREYNSMNELFAAHDIDQKLFKKYHEILV